MNVFDLSRGTLNGILNAFSGLNRLGAHRTKLSFLGAEPGMQSVDLTPGTGPVHRIRVDFRTATELKSGNTVVDKPEFDVLYARASERVTALFPQAMHFPACPEIKLESYSLSKSRVERLSSKTGQRHRLGGFTGYSIYQGDLRECVPVLKAAEFTGVGRHTSWGNGRLLISVVN